MNPKQYEAAQTIMQMSRIFVKAMRECMEHSGLMKDGYELHLHVFQGYECAGVNLINSIRLDPRDINRPGEYEEKAFTNHCYEKEGWVVINDPVLKQGTVPPVVRTAETASRVFKSGKETAKEYPPDGLWISRFDDSDSMDGGQ
jgi:hypothetical protein